MKSKQSYILNRSIQAMLIVAMLLFIAAVFGHMNTYAAETYNGMDWDITDDGELQLGKSGEDQTLTMTGTVDASTWPWAAKKANIKSVKFVGSVKVAGNLSIVGMFDGLVNAKTFANLDYFDVSAVKYINGIFKHCESVKELDLYSWDTGSAVNMRDMFSYARSLETIKLSRNFNTANVTTMARMFEGTAKLKTVDLSKFDVGKVTSFGAMFEKSGIENLDFSSFNIKTTGNSSGDADILMSYMFNGCGSLKEIKFGNGFDTSKVCQMEYMFNGCSALEKLDTSVLDVSAVTHEAGLTGLFRNCSKLKSIDVCHWDTSKIRSMRELFGGCNELEEIVGLSVSPINQNFVTDKVTDMYGMFQNCSKIKSLDGIVNFNTENVKNFGWMFRGCNELERIDVQNFNTSSAVDMTAMFAFCTLLESIPGVENFDTSKVGTETVNSFEFAPGLYGMFRGIEGLTSLDLSKWDTSNVPHFGLMFAECSNLESIDMSNFKMSEAKGIQAMFAHCKKLEELKLPEKKQDIKMTEVERIDQLFDRCNNLPGETIQTIASGIYTDNVINMYNTFGDCDKLESLDISHWTSSNPSKLEIMQGLFCWDENLKELKLPVRLDTSNVKDMTGIFAGLRSIESLDVTWLDTSSAEELDMLFQDCTNLKEIRGLETLKTSNVNRMNSMFANTGLETVDVSTFNTSNVEDMSYMFAYNIELKEIKGLEKLDTSKVKNMSRMFASSGKLRSVDMSNLNTSNVQNMTGMFSNAWNLDNDEMLELDMGKVIDGKLIYENANALKNSLKVQMGADCANYLPADVKTKVQNAAAKIDGAFAEANQLTPAELQEMIAAAKDAISAASSEIPKAATAAKAAADAAKATADAEVAKDSTSDAAKAAVTAAKDAADKAKALADAEKAMADDALRKDPNNADKQAAAKVAADKATAAATAQQVAQQLYNQVATPTVTPPQQKELEVGTQEVAAKNTYEITLKPTATAEGSVKLIKAKNAKNVSIPKTVTLSDGKVYEVDRIAGNAFKAKKIRKVTLGVNVDTIEKNAFKGSKATTLVLTTKNLTKGSVKGSLKGSKVKTVQVKVGSKKVNKKFVKKYKKIFTKKNAGKKVTVK